MEEHSDCRKNLEMIYETKKNVDILNKEIENIKYRLDEFKCRFDEFKLETKEDMKHIDDKLELILQDKKDSYNKIKKPRNYKGKYRCQKEPRHSGIRPRPARFGNAVRTDTGNWSGCVYAFRDVASSLLSRFQKIS